MKPRLEAMSVAVAMAVLSATAGCSRPENPAPTKLHVGHPPHGGIPIEAGDDFRIEFVRDAQSLTAYVLDDDMEEFIRIADKNLEFDVAPDHGKPRKLILNAVASPATGETAGDTSQFEGHADWLKSLPALRGTLKAISIRGSTFHDLPVNIPSTHDQG